MRTPWRAALPLAVTMPRDCARRPRRKQRHRRRALAMLAALGALLLAAGFWLPAKAELAQQLLNRAWQSTAASGGTTPVRPWPWADTGPIARLYVGSATEPMIVLSGASGRNLAFAPALLDGSAPPGTPGVSVIAGHRDTHFRALRDLVVGAELTLERPDGARFTYEVAALDVVDSERAELRLDAEESVLALVTCWPFDTVTVGGSWRYVVTARLRR